MKLLLTILSVIVVSATIHADDISFNRDVRPILSEHCFACHGFDAKARKAKLRLDVPEGAFAERKSGAAITPGKLAESEAWARIISTDSDVVMPPPSTNRILTAAQKTTLKHWIEQGAKYQKHWAFETISERGVRNAKFGKRNPIDALLEARIKAEGLKVNPPADRETLIRRVSFALTGLPPSVKDVDAYLADQSPNAYETMVDRYLNSVGFGEEMARHWLDVARYADTHGLHLDNERSMWAYRDWVVNAFNQNLPFDQFTIWQIAGDLLPNPTPEQLAATGFNRCNVTTGEGGSINAEWIYRNAVDRTSTLAETWLGLTAGCAQCHDHKYDPISQKEFYSLYAFFYSAADPAMDGNVNNTPPFARLSSAAQLITVDAITKRLAETRKQLDAAAANAEYTDPADAKPAPPARRVRDLIFDDSFPFAAATRNTSRNDAEWIDKPSFRTASKLRVLRQKNGYFFETVITPQLRPVIVPTNGKLVVSVRPDPDRVPSAVAISLNGRRLVWGKTIGDTPYANVAKSDVKGDLPKPGTWTKLTVPLDEFGLKPSQRINTIAVQQVGGEVAWDDMTLQGETSPATDPLESFSVWWKNLGGKVPPELPSELNELVTGGPEKKHPEDKVAKLRAFYLAYIARPRTKELVVAQVLWENNRALKDAAEAAIPGSMVFGELGKPRDAFVMMRGQYDKPGDKVEPGVPAALPPLKLAKPGSRATRLDLANWLVSPDHPLTARVTVNRFWQQFFGTGLVKTSYDFGSQGDPPSHPELLDWLALEFVKPTDSPSARAWDVKRFVRLLVTSEAFRRDSKFTPETLAKDPANRFYARGPRFRLDAEQLRDNALFTSGLINREMGGRGVNPYQPPNIWEPVGYGDSNTRYYLQDSGPALYRRSLYVFIKRTAPPPFLVNFDAPNREQFCTIRDRTNTPLQALQLMNDVQHFEAARALAERAIREGGKTREDRIAFLYRTVLARRPDANEVRVVSGAFEKQWELYRANPDAAKKAVRVGDSPPKDVASDAEVAAWALVANLILNLDETVNRN